MLIAPCEPGYYWAIVDEKKGTFEPVEYCGYEVTWWRDAYAETYVIGWDSRLDVIEWGDRIRPPENQIRKDNARE